MKSFTSCRRRTTRAGRLPAPPVSGSVVVPLIDGDLTRLTPLRPFPPLHLTATGSEEMSPDIMITNAYDRAVSALRDNENDEALEGLLQVPFFFFFFFFFWIRKKNLCARFRLGLLQSKVSQILHSDLCSACDLLSPVPGR